MQSFSANVQNSEQCDTDNPADRSVSWTGNSCQGKITPPQLYDRVYSRQKLYSRLDTCFENQASVWVTGLPGSGKTTLCAAYSADRSLHTLWYRLDNADIDPVTFFYYMECIFSCFPDIKAVNLPSWQPNNEETLERFSRRFFRSLYSSCPHAFLVVFDNYQDLPNDSIIQNIILIALKELPSHGQAMFLSRKQPPPQFFSTQMNGMLQLIERQDMSLSVEEIQDFLKMRGGEDLGGNNSKILWKQTHGWITGLILLLEHLDPVGLDSIFLSSCHYQGVFNYFSGEILQLESIHKRECLLYAALFRDIQPKFVEQLSGQYHVDQYLCQLAKKNFFTSLVDSNRNIFHFHPLFREFLLFEAHKRFPPGQLQTVYRQAAAILCEHDYTQEGIELLFSISDWPEMVTILKKNVTNLLTSDRFRSISRWLKKLPQQYDNDPTILYIQGISDTILHPEQSVIELKKAFNLFTIARDEKNILKTCSGIINTLLLNLADLHQIDCWLDILVEKLDTAYKEANNDKNICKNKNNTAALTASVYHGLVLRRPDHPDIEIWRKRYESLNIIGLAATLHYLWTGRFTLAKIALDQQMSARHVQESHLFRSTMYTLRANYFLFTGLYDEGLKTVQQGLDYIKKTGFKMCQFHILTHGAGCCLGQGDIKKADTFFMQALEIKHHARPLDFCYYHLLRAWQALLIEDKLQALYHQKIALKKADDVGIPFIRGICCYVSGMVALLMQRFEKAEEQLCRSLLSSQSIHNSWTESQSRFGLAYLYMVKGDEQQCLRELKEGFSIAAENGYTTYLFCLPGIMAELCVQALSADIESEFVKLFVRSKNLIPQRSPLHLPQWPWPLKLSTLGRFSMSINGKEQEFPLHAQNKPLELLQVLIALGGRQVSETSVVNWLWHDLEGDRQIRTLKTTLHRLRKILIIPNVLLHKNKRLSLNSELCWIDTWLFTRLAGQCGQDPGEKIPPSLIVQQAQKATALYQGIFLPERLDEPWTFQFREQLQRRYRQLVLSAGHSMESRTQWNRAIRLYQLALERDIYCESFYYSLMRCYHGLGFPGEAMAIYRQCKRALQPTTAHPLAAATVELYQKIRFS